MSATEPEAGLSVERRAELERNLEGGLAGYIQRIRNAHQPHFNGRGTYTGCCCGAIPCGFDKLVVHMDDLRRAYEAKVEDFAAETRRTSGLAVALTAAERERDEARAAVADAWDLGWCAGVSRFTQRSEPPKDNPYRATCPPDCERDHAPCGRDRWVEAAERITDPNTASDA